MADVYVSVPTEIEAIQFDGQNWGEIVMFTGTREIDGMHVPIFNRVGTFMVNLLQGPKKGQIAELYVSANNSHVYIETGEWVCKDAKGFYPCKDDMFKKKYRKKDGA